MRGCKGVAGGRVIKWDEVRGRERVTGGGGDREGVEV